MAWTTPKTWVTGEALTAADMNTYIKDNQLALFDRPNDSYVANEGADYTTANTSFEDIDGTNWSFTLTTTGAHLLAGLNAMCRHDTVNATVHFNIDIDGSPVEPDDGMFGMRFNVTSLRMNCSFTRLITGLSAAEHIIKLQWKTTAGNVAMPAGAATAAQDVHPQFYVHEL